MEVKNVNKTTYSPHRAEQTLQVPTLCNSTLSSSAISCPDTYVFRHLLFLLCALFSKFEARITQSIKTGLAGGSKMAAKWFKSYS